MKKQFITKSVKKNATIFTVVLFVGYLIFNFFTVLQINYYFIDNIDTRLAHETEHIKFSLEVVDDQIVILSYKEFQEFDMRHETDNSFFLQIYDTNGKIIFQSENMRYLPNMPIHTHQFDEDFLFEDEKVNFNGLRVCYSKIMYESNVVGFIQLATPKTTVNSAIEGIVAFNLITLPIAFILFVIVSLVFAKRSLKPIHKIIKISEEITATNLSKRIDYEADAEDVLGRLKATLNNLFDRLESQINQISQFSDNASHQLMTPLTAISTELEYILKKPRSAEEYNETIKIVEEQTSEMITIVKTLLILAKDCEVCSDSKKVFNLSNLINSEIEKEFANNNISIIVKENIYLKGEADYFVMVLQNLISNAIKYSSKNDEVKIIAEKKKEFVKISVYDTGTGIPEDEKSKIFDRFYRGNNVENNMIKGHGLGLNLVKIVVNKMGGKVSIVDNQPKGSIFILEMPKLILE